MRQIKEDILGRKFSGKYAEHYVLINKLDNCKIRSFNREFGNIF